MVPPEPLAYGVPGTCGTCDDSALHLIIAFLDRYSSVGAEMADPAVMYIAEKGGSRQCPRASAAIFPFTVPPMAGRWRLSRTRNERVS
jgi:hypothetical protein